MRRESKQLQSYDEENEEPLETEAPLTVPRLRKNSNIADRTGDFSGRNVDKTGDFSGRTDFLQPDAYSAASKGSQDFEDDDKIRVRPLFTEELDQ
jgi:hypothetical protein